MQSNVVSYQNVPKRTSHRDQYSFLSAAQLWIGVHFSLDKAKLKLPFHPSFPWTVISWRRRLQPESSSGSTAPRWALESSVLQGKTILNMRWATPRAVKWLCSHFYSWEALMRGSRWSDRNGEKPLSSSGSLTRHSSKCRCRRSLSCSLQIKPSFLLFDLSKPATLALNGSERLCCSFYRDWGHFISPSPRLSCHFIFTFFWGWECAPASSGSTQFGLIRLFWLLFLSQCKWIIFCLWRTKLRWQLHREAHFCSSVSLLCVLKVPQRFPAVWSFSLSVQLLKSLLLHLQLYIKKASRLYTLSALEHNRLQGFPDLHFSWFIKL